MRIFSHIVNKGYNSPTVSTDLPKEEPKELPIVVNGPLSEVYTQALNQIYAKTDEATGEALLKPALETQANDASAVAALVGELTTNPTSYIYDIPHTYVYATRRDLITPNSLDDLQSNIDDFESDKGAVRYVLVNDSTNPDQQVIDRPIGEIINIGRTLEAMESFVLSKGGVVVHSFADIFRK